MTRRGLILVPEFSVDIASNQLELRNVGGGPMEAMVKQNLPYWDMFDLPDNPIMGIGLTPSLEFLKSEGIVRKTNARPNFSGGMAEIWVRAQLEAFRLNEKQEPGAWTLAQQGESFWLPDDERIRTRVIEATLYKALPVPGADVAIQDILEFKIRRADELLALRTELDSLYLSLVSEADIPRATSAALARLTKALLDVDKISTETWATKLRSTLKVDISLTNVTSGAMLGATAAATFAFPVAIGAGLGAAGAVVKFELKPEAAGAKASAGSPSITYARKVESELGQA
jgi:hypothetical protein